MARQFQFCFLERDGPPNSSFTSAGGILDDGTSLRPESVYKGNLRPLTHGHTYCDIRCVVCASEIIPISNGSAINTLDVDILFSGPAIIGVFVQVYLEPFSLPLYSLCGASQHHESLSHARRDHVIHGRLS